MIAVYIFLGAWYLTGFFALTLGIFISGDKSWNVKEILMLSLLGPVTAVASIYVLKTIIMGLSAQIEELENYEKGYWLS